MTDPTPTPSADAVSVSAILARRSQQDRAELLEELVTLFIGVMPGIEVKRALVTRKIKSLRVPIGDRAYVLDRSRGGSFEARRQHIVRNVVIRNDPIEIDAFIAELSAALDAEARRTERGREALDTWLKSNL
jgi:hypothetical protein